MPKEEVHGAVSQSEGVRNVLQAFSQTRVSHMPLI